jgi:hypothetical protein
MLVFGFNLQRTWYLVLAWVIGDAESVAGAGASDGVESITPTGAIYVKMRDGNDIRCRTWLSCIARMLLVLHAWIGTAAMAKSESKAGYLSVARRKPDPAPITSTALSRLPFPFVSLRFQ